ncbi:MAG: hypothetical protein HKN63_02500 [Rhodobacteraceae bacterium]|nr:hypothetical protein [Paracoccaceae bacterium]
MNKSASFIAACAAAVLMAGAADAACFADYKAKQDNPLRLHYGVIQLDEAACNNTRAAAGEVKRRIARGGWTLLNVMSIFDEGGLDERKGSAGEYFLRF